jgi:hypothetical protein
MSDREKLIELLREVQYLGGLEEKIADHLIANGVTVGDKFVPTADNLSSTANWIPVDEKLPELFADILVFDAKYQEIHLAYMTEAEWVGVRMNGKVTHWAPLPKFPN